MKKYLIYSEQKNIENHGESACVMFKTDALKFSIEYVITEKKNGNYPHVGITAREGLAVLYRKCKENEVSYWEPVDLFAGDSPASVNMSHLIRKNEMYEIIIHGPILSHLEKVLIHLEDTDYFEQVSEKADKEILLLGGVHTFGTGVTSAGMIFSNIFKREYCVNIHKYAFNSKNFLKPLNNIVQEISDFSQYDLVILEADTYGQADEIVQSELKQIIHRISEARNVIVWHSLPEQCKHKRDYIASVLGQENTDINYCDMDDLFSPSHKDMCTYSINFLNDAGNVMIYHALNKEIRENIWNI